MAGALENARKALREAAGEKESEYGAIYSVSGPGELPYWKKKKKKKRSLKRAS